MAKKVQPKSKEAPINAQIWFVTVKLGEPQMKVTAESLTVTAGGALDFKMSGYTVEAYPPGAYLRAYMA
jgi:hypothetical protein